MVEMVAPDTVLDAKPIQLTAIRRVGWLHAFMMAVRNMLPDASEPAKVVPGPTHMPASIATPEVTSADAHQAARAHGNLFTPDQAEARDRALIEQLIAATRLYATSNAVKELLEFTINLRAFAPFNAMLLHIQKPGLTHAATAADWWRRFRRVPKTAARPIVVLRAMGPVDFVFDILDTDGHDLPAHAFTFPTLGSLSRTRFDEILGSVGKSGIELLTLDRGDSQAG